MSSKRRTEASRANGARSRGPVTPEGKQRSAQNAFKHGVLARNVVIRGESIEEFDSLLSRYVTLYPPEDAVQFALIEEMAVSYWRLHRIWAMESGLFDKQIGNYEGPSDLNRVVNALDNLAGAPSLPLLHRYEARLTRMYHRALKDLLHLRRHGNLDDPDSGQSVLLPPAPVLPPAAASRLDGTPVESIDPAAVSNENSPLRNEPNPITERCAAALPSALPVPPHPKDTGPCVTSPFPPPSPLTSSAAQNPPPSAPGSRSHQPFIQFPNFPEKVA